MDLQQRIAYHHEKGEFQLPGQQTFLRPWRLYRGAELGRLTGPNEPAAVDTRIELPLTFTAGQDIPAGSILRVLTPGFNPYNFIAAEPADGKACERSNKPARTPDITTGTTTAFGCSTSPPVLTTKPTRRKWQPVSRRS